jgi:hypothetical protein
LFHGVTDVAQSFIFYFDSDVTLKVRSVQDDCSVGK